MKISKFHNYYKHPGGEDVSAHSEVLALRKHGHDVSFHTYRNESISGMSYLTTPFKAIWNRQSYHDVRRILRREKPDIVHCHNTFPLISPSIYYAAEAEGVPVVQTLANYRLLCTSANLYRDNKICTVCAPKKVPWNGVVHRCYKNSYATSAAVAAMRSLHLALGTWTEHVTAYVALTEFSKRMFVSYGFPEDRIFVKPNFIYPAPAVGDGQGRYAVYVGRLSEEKGLRVLLEAWRSHGIDVTLKIIGNGPLLGLIRQAAQECEYIEYLGQRNIDETYDIIGGAQFTVFPSTWYEPFGRVVIESLAKGTPVIAADLGHMGDMIHDGKDGLLYRPDDARDLAAKIALIRSDDDRRSRMREEARRSFEQRYTADTNVEQLLNIYRRAIDLKFGCREAVVA